MLKDILKENIMDGLLIAKAACTQLTAVELSNYAGVVETDTTCPNTRELIKDLIRDGNLIGANSKGYWIMTTGKEVQQVLNSLLKRQMGISRRIQSIYDAAIKRGIL